MGHRADLPGLVGLLCLVAGCSKPAPEPCRPEGTWRADMGVYEGTARIAPTGGDRVRVELTGKTTQAGAGQWMPGERRLDFDLPTASYRCEASADCRTLTCAPGPRPDGGQAGTLVLRR